MDPVFCAAHPESGNLATISISIFVMLVVNPSLPVRYCLSAKGLLAVFEKTRPSDVLMPVGAPTMVRSSIFWAPVFTTEVPDVVADSKLTFTTSATTDPDPAAGFASTTSGEITNATAIATAKC
jgi:hypothetical protein